MRVTQRVNDKNKWHHFHSIAHYLNIMIRPTGGLHATLQIPGREDSQEEGGS